MNLLRNIKFTYPLKNLYNLQSMGNELQKQYGLKEKPLKLSGSYNFLKYAQHPSDPHTTLIIVKHPHRAGVIVSDIIVPVKEIKPLSHSDYSLALCKKCTPLALVKPRSQVEMKLMIKQIVKLSSQIGRIFYCSGRLMLWCEQTRSAWQHSPQEIQKGKKSEKSNVFLAGICLINYLNFVYQPIDAKKKKDKNKPQLENFFNPKDKKQYFDFINNLAAKLSKSHFWSKISEGMKNLIIVMLAKDPFDRIDMKTLLKLPYFSHQIQLKLYHMIADDLLGYEEKQSIMLMQTLQIVIKDRNVFDNLILEEYLTPILSSQLEKKPQMIISAIIELPNPPIKAIYHAMKKVNAKNIRFFNNVLLKLEKLYDMMDQEAYDAGISRTIFCRYLFFQCEQLHQRLIRILPFALRTIKEPNYKKQIELQLILNILENPQIKPSTLLISLKCMIALLNQKLLSTVTKIYALKYDPYKYEQQLEVNIHILQLYKFMIEQMQPTDMISIMIPKLQPYLVKEEVTDELFFKAKKCVDQIMTKLSHMRDINPNDEFDIEYDREFFRLIPPMKPPEKEVINVLMKETSKNKNQDIAWLSEILQKKEHLLQEQIQ